MAAPIDWDSLHSALDQIAAGSLQRLVEWTLKDLHRGSMRVEPEGKIFRFSPAPFVSWLEMLKADRQRAAAHLRPELSPHLRFVLIQPVLLAGPAPPPALRVLYGTPGARVAHTVLLLLDESLGLSKRLERCRYCKRFFLVDVPGWRKRPQRTHCSQMCRTKDRRAMSAERMAAFRADMSVKRWRKVRDERQQRKERREMRQGAVKRGSNKP